MKYLINLTLKGLFLPNGLSPQQNNYDLPIKSFLMNSIKNAIGVLVSTMRLTLVASASIVVPRTSSARASLSVCVPSGVLIFEF